MEWPIFAVIIVLFGVFVLGAVLYNAMSRPGAGEPMTEDTAEMVGPQYTTGTDYASKELYTPISTPHSLRELTSAERIAFYERWRNIQAMFVDGPDAGLRSADLLALEVLEARGYTGAALDTDRLDLVLEHSPMLDDYRAAHAQLSAHEIDPEDSQRLEETLDHYRALFAELLQAPPAAA